MNGSSAMLEAVKHFDSKVDTLNETLAAAAQAFMVACDGLEKMQAVIDKIHEALADNKPPKPSPLIDEVKKLTQAVRNTAEACREMPDLVRDAIHEEIAGKDA